MRHPSVEGIGELFGAGRIEMKTTSGVIHESQSLPRLAFYLGAKCLTFSVFLLFLFEAVFTFLGEAKLSSIIENLRNEWDAFCGSSTP
jgi:hypothetical protein